MPYIGNTIRAADDYRLIDDISSGFNGSTTQFALQVAGSAPVPFPKSPQQVLISVNGVIQEPDPTGASGFNLVGTNIVFSSAPTNGHAFFGIIYATADYLNSGGNFPSGSLGAPSITFVGDEDTGIYRKGSGSIGFVSDSTEIANTDSNGITISSGNLIIPDKIIHNGDPNTAIRFPAADEISFETGGTERFKITDSESVFNDGSTNYDFRVEGGTDANLLFIDGSADKIGIGQGTPGAFDKFVVQGTGNVISAQASSGSVGIGLFEANTGRFFLKSLNGNDGLSFVDGDNSSERMRIDSSGRLLLGTTTAGYSGGDDLTINTSGDTGLTIRSGTSNQGTIAFADGTTGSDQYRGFIQYFHNGDVLMFGTSGANRLKIDPNGHFLPNADSTFNIGSSIERFANGYFDTLYGDGSNLTGISAGTTLSGSTNNTVCTVTGANAIQGESNVVIDSNGRLGIGVASHDPLTALHAQGNSAGALLDVFTITNQAGTANTEVGMVFECGADELARISAKHESSDTGSLIFSLATSQTANPTEIMRIRKDGRVGILKSDPVATLEVDGTGHFVVTDSGIATHGIHLKGHNGNAGEFGGAISFACGDNGSSAIAAVQLAQDADKNGLSFFTHGSTTGADNSGERMRLGNNESSVYIGKVDNEVSVASSNGDFSEGVGVTLAGGGTGCYNIFSANLNTTMYIKRQGNDGALFDFRQNGSQEGSISVSGSTVSYNGGHLSRWSQLAGISETDKSSRPEIYQGTVMSNLDELCSWSHPDVLYTEEEEINGQIPKGKKAGDVKIAAYTEENQQLNMTKVSDVDGDKDVAGVFWAWDDDDDEYVNDFYIAMTGDMVIRVAASTTVARGDLLISAGDGTAKPQADDIVRSSTIAKIISTNHTATYADGSKAYPCVLMAC